MTTTITPEQADTLPAEALGWLTGGELWELLFGIMAGNVPKEITDTVLDQLADAIKGICRADATADEAKAALEAAREARILSALDTGEPK